MGGCRTGAGRAAVVSRTPVELCSPGFKIDAPSTCSGTFGLNWFTMRLFVGITLAEKVVEQLERACARLRMHADGLRWSAPHAWHITLQFLGNANAEQFDCLLVRLAEVRAAVVPVRLGELGVFERPGVLLVKVDPTVELVELQQRVVEATAKCGFVPEERPYQPHITLARAKSEGGRRHLKTLKGRADAQPQFAGFTAREFVLFESHLGPEGSRYEVRGRMQIARS